MKIFCAFMLVLHGFLSGPLVHSQSHAPANQDTLQPEDLKKIQQNIQMSKYLKMDFEQTSVSGLRGHKSVRQGRAYFLSPDKFNWMLETPVKEYKIFDGVSFYDYSPESSRAIQHAPHGKQVEQLRQVVDVVMNFDSLLKNYQLISAHRNQLVFIKLKPLKSSDIKEISLTLDEKNATVTNVTMEMLNKNKLIHDFKNPSKTSFSLDVFKIPSNVKISKGL